VVCDEDDFLDDVLRLATVSGIEPEVAIDPAAARLHWSVAPLVLVTERLGGPCVRAGLPHRPGVVLVSRRPPPDHVPASGVSGPLGLEVVSPPYDVDRDSADMNYVDIDSVDRDYGEFESDLEGFGLWQLARDLGAGHVAFVPAADRWLVDHFMRAAGPVSDGRVVGVVGGRGGAGASVLAAALAVTAARHGLRSFLVDADPLGGGIDLLVGREDAPGLRWPDLAATAGRVSAPALLTAVPQVAEVGILSWDRGELLAVPPAAMDAAIDAGRRGSDLVVVDLPRRPDAAAVRAMQAADTVLLLVPAEVRACAAARRVATLISPHCARMRCVVRGPAPAGLRSRDLSDALGMPVAGVVRSERGLAAAVERGEVPAGRGRGQLAEVSRQLLAGFELLEAAA